MGYAVDVGEVGEVIELLTQLDHPSPAYAERNEDVLQGLADCPDAAHEIDIERSPNHHVAFGAAAHRCVGSHFARLMLRVGLEVLIERVKYCTKGMFSCRGPSRSGRHDLRGLGQCEC